MAEANTSSTQQASDAQHVDNMTSMQQSTPDAPSGARSDAPVQTTNVGSQDGPSQLNANPNGNSANNNNLGSIARNSPIDGGSSGTVGNSPTRGGDGGGINGLAGNGGGEGQQGQGGTGDSGARGGNAGGNNSGGGGSSNAGIVAAAGAGARGAGGFGGAGAGSGSGSGNANGPTSGGGEGGGANPPPANATPPASGTPTVPVLLTTAPDPVFTPVDANLESNSSGQPNSPAVITGTTSGRVVEAGGVNNTIAGTPTTTGLLISTDVDNLNTFTVVSSPRASTSGYGTYTMDADGTWHYALTNSNAAVQALNVSNTLTDTFTVASIDGTTQVITVTIAGVNDNAVIAAATTATFGAFTGNASTTYFHDAYYGDLMARHLIEVASYDAAALSLSLNADYSNAVTSYNNALVSYNNAVSLGSATHDELLALHNDLEIALDSMLTLSADRDIAQSTMLGTEYEIAHYDTINKNSTLIDQGVISIRDVDSANQFQPALLTSHDGNLGTLVLGADGSYTYQIMSVPKNDAGQYDPGLSGSTSETYVLESFTTLFNASNHHTDTFTVTSADFTTADVHFILKGDHNILGSVINTVTPTGGTADVQSISNNLDFAVGTHDIRVIEGSNSNPNFGPNIGSLVLNEDGSYTYTVSEASILNYEAGHDPLISGRDTFIITSTLGADTTIQEMSFNIFQEHHITVANSSDLSLTGVGTTDNVFEFDSWGAIRAGSHSISHFELGDRVDLSSLLNDPVDQLSGTIYIDPSLLGSQHSTLSVLAPASGGGVEPLPVASVNGLWSVSDLMWNARSGIDQSSALNEASSWTETLDLSHVTQTSSNHFTGAAGWSMDITSTTGSTASTSGAAHQILFDGNAGQVTIHTYDGIHEINNVDKIIWHTA